MKKNLKKALILFLVIGCMFAFAGCGSSESTETSSADILEQANNDSITSILSNLANTMQTNTYSSLQAYLEEGSTYVSPIFDNSFSQAWSSFEETHGTITETTVENAVTDDSGFSGKIVATGEDGEQMAFTVTFNETGTPVKVFVENYSSSDEEETLGQKMGQAGMNTLMGVVIVFAMLAVLSLLIYCFKFVNAFANRSGKKAVEEKKPAPVVKAAAPVVQENLVDDGELVAVIAAAIAASENTSTDSFVVRSIKRVKSNKWQRA